ncbi:hypothetical protein TUBRATIS_000030 [Tubulinosema ratisbonensis]|uniref:Uncharacterized protein n=1 Tax=Tubulinosema ratisbonensis TaxID=291195 RepID=A0A437AQR6_9MICR|nr:hypothetical protein TUBRATIS_000030 [Tubulinosema ratisbonensis]
MNYNELIDELNLRKERNEGFLDILKKIEEIDDCDNQLHKEVTLAVDYLYLEEKDKGLKYALRSVKTFSNLLKTVFLTKEEKEYFTELLENALKVLFEVCHDKFYKILNTKICFYIQNFGKNLFFEICQKIFESQKFVLLFYALKIINLTQLSCFKQLFNLVYILYSCKELSIFLDLIVEMFLKPDNPDNIKIILNNFELVFERVKVSDDILIFLKINLFCFEKVSMNDIFDLCINDPNLFYQVYFNCLKVNKVDLFKKLIILFNENKSILSDKHNNIIKNIKLNNLTTFYNCKEDLTLTKQYFSLLFSKKEYNKIIDFYENNQINLKDSLFFDTLTYKCYLEINQLIKANNLDHKITFIEDYSILKYKIILYTKLTNHISVINLFNNLTDKHLFIKLMKVLYLTNSPKLTEIVYLFMNKFEVNIYILKVFISLLFISDLSVHERGAFNLSIVKPIKVKEIQKELRNFLSKVIYNTIIETYNHKSNLLIKLTNLLYKVKKSYENIFLILFCYFNFSFNNQIIKKTQKMYNKFIKKDHKPSENFYNINILYFILLKKEECYNNLLPLNKLSENNLIFLVEIISKSEDINKKVSVILECKNRNINFDLIIENTTNVNLLCLFEKISLFFDIKKYFNLLDRLKENIYDEYLIERINKLKESFIIKHLK